MPERPEWVAGGWSSWTWCGNNLECRERNECTYSCKRRNKPREDSDRWDSEDGNAEVACGDQQRREGTRAALTNAYDEGLHAA